MWKLIIRNKIKKWLNSRIIDIIQWLRYKIIIKKRNWGINTSL